MKQLTESVVFHLSERLKEPEWMKVLRQKAWENYVQMDMPSLQYGLRVGITLGIDFDRLVPDCEQQIEITNENDGVMVIPFSEALRSHPALIKQIYQQVIGMQDKFAALHFALMTRGVLVYVPRGVEAEKHITINFPSEGKAVFDHVIVFGEENSKVRILTTSSGNPMFRSEVVEILTHENAQVDYGSIHDLAKNSVTFTAKKALLAKDSKVSWMECCMGGRLTRSQVVNLLQGAGAEAYNYGMFYGDGEQVFDLVTQNIHEVGNTTSDMLTRGALDGKAKCIYRGLVKVCAGARNSNGYQKEETLLLSQDAEVDVIPDLVIDNNEVKCSHGATIKRLGEDELFYLQSRGLSKKQAQYKLVEGFFEHMIRKLKNKALEESLRSQIIKRNANNES